MIAKLEWYRAASGASARQWQDIVGILKVQGSSIDRAYLRAWAQRLGLSELLGRVLEDAGLEASD